MDSGLLKLFRQLQNKSYLKADRKLIIFFIFLLISAFFWLLNALDNKYTTKINYPVKFKNFPEDKIIASEIPQNIELKIQAKGFIILRYYLSTTLPPIMFDINSFYEKKSVKTLNTNIYIITNLVKEKLQNQLSSELTILDINPDTIQIQLSTSVTKKIPVVEDLDISYKSQFMLSGKIKIVPDSVEITGPSNIIDTINFVKTKKSIFKDLDKNISRNISLLEIENTLISSNRVIIEIPVEKFTESSFEGKISVINLPTNVSIKLFPSEVKAKFHIAESQYFQINTNSIKFFIDYNNIDSINKTKLKIEHEPLNDIIKNFTFHPEYIDYIIEK